ncbi:unnamed protein product [Prorocentrum cordatum]|uniref:Uncharacterized protein n=1 Tax=Prorocentrum cordatum TaxID=2364126 RepID=A0ABN9PJ21_9DINO|nr:unnamed protein product [Polarella glacialis]
MMLKEKCSMTDAEWEERQKTRAAEMAAVSKALAILSTDDAHDLYTRTFNKGASLLQQRSSAGSARRDAASKVIADAAKRLHSQGLSKLALTVKLDAFERVKKAIDDMLAALQEQQAAEVKHKDFCVAELDENQLQTEKKTMEKQDLEALIAKLETTIKHLTEALETLKAEIAEMEVQMKRAGETREKENAEFQVTVADQRATQQILKKALAALGEFYGKHPPALVQKQAPEGFAPPKGFDVYEKSAGSSGVMALLSQIVTDAKAMEDETVRAEEDMQKAYEAFVIETNASIEAKNKEIVNKSLEKAKAEERLVEAEADLDSTNTELGELADYNAQLHGSCDFTLKNFDLRQEARMEEMDALRQAKQILSGADFGAFLQMACAQRNALANSRVRVTCSQTVSRLLLPPTSVTLRFVRGVRHRGAAVGPGSPSPAPEPMQMMRAAAAAVLMALAASGLDTQDMLKQLETEAETDEEIYDLQMACWCETNEKEKTKSIKEAEARIAQLETKIEEDTALSAKLESEMRELEEEVAKNQGALDKADPQGAGGLQRGGKGAPGGNHGAQVCRHRAVEAPRRGVLAGASRQRGGRRRHAAARDGQARPPAPGRAHPLRAQGRCSLHPVAPGDYFDAEPTFKQSYAPQSGEIFGILEQMKEAFEKDLSQSQKTEMANQKAYDELKAAKVEQIEAGQAQIDKKSQEKRGDGRAPGQLEAGPGGHESLAADEKFLMMLKEKCSMTDAEWEERQKTRAAEMAAVSKALAILSTDDAHDLYTRTFNKGASLLQQRSSAGSARRDAASKVIADAAKRLHSQGLSKLALTVKLDAFERVKKAIDDMLAALQEQQAAEVKHKDFCVAELDENQLQTEKKTMEKQDLEALIAKLETTIKHLTEALETLKAEIAEMEVQMKRAGETREKENAEFQVTVADQRATQQILKKALAALGEFYGKHTPALVQKQAPEGFAPPKGFDVYEKSAGSSGVMALLSQIVTDAKAMEDEIVRAEEDMQKAYEAFVIETNASIEAKNKEIVNKSLEKAKAEERLVEAEADLDSTNTELGELADYNAQLHGSCDFTLKNFDLRQEARMEEMDALRQAKQILSGADFGAFLQMA